MNSTSTAPFSTELAARLRPALPGLLLAVLTLLFGFGLGIAFGFNEDGIRAGWKTSAMAVRETVYNSNDATIATVNERAWRYLLRAHLHAGGLGASALGLIGALVLLGTAPAATRAISFGLGAGGLGYSVYWMWAAYRAPVLGGTGAAKESLKWLAMPASALVVLATAAVAVLLVRAMLARRAVG